LYQDGYLEETFITAYYSKKVDKMGFSSDRKMIIEITKNKPFVLLQFFEEIYDNSPAQEAIIYANKLKE